MIEIIQSFSLRTSLHALKRDTSQLILRANASLLSTLAGVLVYEVADEARKELRRGNLNQAAFLHAQARKGQTVIAKRLHPQPVRRRRRRHH